jgi:hypothetical protein
LLVSENNQNSMPRLNRPHSLVARALLSGLAGVYFFSNVVVVHAAETAFWNQRRHAARAQSQSSADEDKPAPLYAQLPASVSAPRDLSAVLDRVPPQTTTDLSHLGKEVVQTTDRRIQEVAQTMMKQ